MYSVHAPGLERIILEDGNVRQEPAPQRLQPKLKRLCITLNTSECKVMTSMTRHGRHDRLEIVRSFITLHLSQATRDAESSSTGPYNDIIALQPQLCERAPTGRTNQQVSHMLQKANDCRNQES